MAVLSPTQLAHILLLLNLLLSAFLATMWKKATYKSVQLVSFSAWPWLPSLYLQYLQSPSDLSSRGEIFQALNLASQKIHSALFDRHLRLSLKLHYCFPWVFLTFQILFFFSPPEQRAQHRKDKAGWGTQALSSVGAAGREEGQQDGCERAHTATALN